MGCGLGMMENAPDAGSKRYVGYPDVLPPDDPKMYAWPPIITAGPSCVTMSFSE